jgi:hypothetical protein
VRQTSRSTACLLDGSRMSREVHVRFCEDVRKKAVSEGLTPNLFYGSETSNSWWQETWANKPFST